VEREQKQGKKTPNVTVLLVIFFVSKTADWQQSGWYKGEKLCVTKEQVRGKTNFTEVRCCAKTTSV